MIISLDSPGSCVNCQSYLENGSSVVQIAVGYICRDCINWWVAEFDAEYEELADDITASPEWDPDE